MHPMTLRQASWLLLLLVFESVLFLWVGLSMWREPDTAAEDAVGLALLTVGVALAVPTFVFACVVLRWWNRRA